MERIIDIKNLSRYKENNRIEAKRAKSGVPNSIWETYSSFSNTDGGVILLGVEEQDDHTLVATGVEDAHKMIVDIWNTVNNRQKVSLNILTEHMITLQEIEGKSIVVIEVSKADRHYKPIYIGMDPLRGTYRRNYEGDYLCTKDEIAAMFRDASDVSVDQKVLVSQDISILDKDTVRRYRNRFAQFHPAHIWNDDDDELFLRHIGGIALSETDKAFHPTCAGLLMFGHEYDIVREFPHYFLDYREKESEDIRWSHRLTSSSGEWSGNIYDFFFRVYPKITADIPVPFTAKGMSREDETPLHLALREVLLNCLAHSDFYARQGIVIVKSKDEISISNPGDIRIGLATALSGGVSDPRNETIMKMFSLVDIGERAGSGISDFVNIWVKHIGLEPTYNIQIAPDRTTLTIPFPANKLLTIATVQHHNTSESGLLVHQSEAGNGLSVHQSGAESGLPVHQSKEESGLNGTALQILELLKQNPNISYDELAHKLGKARSGVAKHIKILVEKGIIIPKSKNGIWKIGEKTGETKDTEIPPKNFHTF